MARALALAGSLSFVVLLLALAALGRYEREGPPHLDLTLERGIEARLYMPPGFDLRALRAPGEGDRPPAVVLAHGFASDRATVSTLARRLAGAGFAVLTPDLPGHGASRPRFRPDPTSDANAEALALGVAYLRTLPWVDGERIAVAGHSMGAAAAMRLAERESGLDAVVLLSGGRQLLGPWQPPNALFLYAEHDPERTRRAAAALAAALAGRELASGERAGDLAAGTGVRRLELPGNDHSSMLWSPAAARETIAWLHEAFGLPGAAPGVPADPRLFAVGVAALALPLVLLAAGALAGRFSIGSAPLRARGDALPRIGLALLLTLPLAAVAPPARLLGLVLADAVVGWLALAGVLLCATLFARGDRLALAGPGSARSLVAGSAGFVAVYAVLAPLGVVVHFLAPTPERALRALCAGLLLLPFFLAFETLLRRGGGWAAALQGALGRLLLLAALVGAVLAGALAPVVLLLLGPFAVGFAVSELLAAGLYASSRDPLAIAWADATVMGWMLAVSLPLQ